MAVRTYDPKLVSLSVMGNPISGYADGSAIVVERRNDMWATSVGADGVDTSRAKSNDKSGTITITLAQTSGSNDILAAYMKADEVSNNGVVAINCTDTLGTTELFTAKAWIRKAPNVEFSKEVTSREWVFDCADLDMSVGGNSVTTTSSLVLT